MAEFEFIISAECGTPLQIAEGLEIDADAVRIVIEELAQP
jgi:hypothetical protein